MTLDKAKIGKSVKILTISGDEEFKRRIIDMGIITGISATVLKVAPLGDPIEIQINSYCIMLRKAIAKNIEVEYV